MDFFKLSLKPRLALAVISGALTYPAERLDTLYLGDVPSPLFSWWLIFHGAIFGILVMAPFVDVRSLRSLRVIALIVASIFSYDAAMRVPGIRPSSIIFDPVSFMFAGLTGALLVATAIRFIAPLRAGPEYWAYTAAAGLSGGLIFYFTFDICDGGPCRSAWQIIPYASGWIIWQTLVLLAMYEGQKR